MNVNLKRYIDNAIKRKVRRLMLKVNGRKNDDLPVSPEAMESAYKYIRACLDKVEALEKEVFADRDVPQAFDQCKRELKDAHTIITLFRIGVAGVKSDRKRIEEIKNHLKMALRYFNSLRTTAPTYFQSNVKKISSLIETAIVRLS